MDSHLTTTASTYADRVRSLEMEVERLKSEHALALSSSRESVQAAVESALAEERARVAVLTAAHSAHRQWLHSQDCLLQVLCLVAFTGHPAKHFASLTRAFRGDEVLWGCIKDRQGRKGWTFLMASARSGDLGRVRWLLDRGADVNAAESAHGMTSLMLACKNVSVLRELLRGDANVNAAQSDGTTSLMLACQSGHLEVVCELLGHGADVNALRKYNGMTSLMLACKNGHLEIVRELLWRDANANAAQVDDSGMTPLMWACQSGNMDVVQLLLAQGASVSGALSGECRSPLMCACWAGHLEVVRHLLGLGADMNAVQTGTSEGKNSLMWACEGGRLEVVRELLGLGADMNAVQTGDSGGKSPLMWACESGRLEVVRELLGRGAPANAALSVYGMNPLMHACENGQLEVVRELLGRGADANAALTAAGETCQTSLMRACEGGYVEIARELLGAGADVNAARTVDGMTSLMWACENAWVDGEWMSEVKKVVRLLLDPVWGINVNAARTDNGMTSLMLACTYGHRKVARLLLERHASKTAVCMQGMNAYAHTSENFVELREMVKP